MADDLISGLEVSAAPQGGEHPFEEALLRAASTPDLDPAAVFAEALARAVGARCVLVSTRSGRRRKRLAGHWVDGSPIGRPDKLFHLEELEAVARGGGAGWVRLETTGERWRAGLRLEGPREGAGVLLLEGGGAPPWQPRPGELIDPRRVALLASAAIAIGELKAENSRLDEELSLATQGRPSATMRRSTPAVRAMLEYALSGNPVAGSVSELFAQFPEIIGQSAAIGGVLQAVLTAARSDIPVLIEGESGTGKELVARAIHRVSRRGACPFVCENCGAVPESLVESELFGHEKGAFTGADRQKPGVFERANGGTVFLDEVGEMDVSLQRKLLRVLQEKEVRRIGGQETVAVDFRLLSATNRVLEEMVAAGKFREDLYYRLNVVTISMPAVRERPDDIPLLVRHFNQIFAAETGRNPIELTDRALEALCAYRWPGNVRELRNEVWGHSCSDRTLVDVEHLSPRILRGLPDSEESSTDSRPPQPPLFEVERGTVGALILDALRRSKGNRAEAARRLGISRASLYRRMAKYRLVDEAERSSRDSPPGDS
jgi:transcriptional regulator with GAF, ATPase, and Fis domain